MRPGRLWPVAFAVVVVLHLAALYWPRVEMTGVPVDTDKLGHAILFAVPTFVGVVAWCSWWPALILIVHAPVSEYLQAAVLPHRSGSVADAVADLAGVALGSLAAVAYLRWAGRGAGATVSS